MNPQPRHDETTMRIEIQLKASKAPGSKLILLGGGTVKLNPSSLLGIESEMTSGQRTKTNSIAHQHTQDRHHQRPTSNQRNPTPCPYCGHRGGHPRSGRRDIRNNTH